MPMTLPTVPDGTYFSVIGNVRLEAGGQTRLALLRHRLFALHTGHELPILTFNPIASYAPIRAGLLEQGQLLEQSRLLNMHEDLRVRDLLGSGPQAASPTSPGIEDVEDGYVWRRSHPGAGRIPPHLDYFRPDGSLYARTPPLGATGPAAIFDRAGREVASWSSLGGLWRWWASTRMPPAGRVFLISDSRFIADELSLLEEERIFVLHQMHNPHLSGERRWNSAVSESYRASMDGLDRLDALISLSGRQRDDIAKRYGATSNLFVIPNPVESPPMPAVPSIRRPYSLAMIARLDGQKRIDRAIEAFARVVAARPEATLDVYGDGDLREALQAQIDTAGLSGSITLHGHDPQAREALWTASVFWLTSQFEGYPLSTLEAMSHGCPAISFDMKYGPREQIDDGVDGFLIPQGDIDGLAARTIAVLDDQPALDSMRTAARAKAAAHGHERFLADWISVLEEVVTLKFRRTRVEDAVWDIRVTEHTADAVAFRGTLTLIAGDPVDLDGVEVRFDVYSPDHDELVAQPVDVTRVGRGFTIDGRVDRAQLESVADGARTVRLRLSYVWQNSAGRTEVLPGGFVLVEQQRSVRTRVGAILRRAGLRA